MEFWERIRDVMVQVSPENAAHAVRAALRRGLLSVDDLLEVTNGGVGDGLDASALVYAAQVLIEQRKQARVKREFWEQLNQWVRLRLPPRLPLSHRHLVIKVFVACPDVLPQMLLRDFLLDGLHEILWSLAAAQALIAHDVPSARCLLAAPQNPGAAALLRELLGRQTKRVRYEIHEWYQRLRLFGADFAAAAVAAVPDLPPLEEDAMFQKAEAVARAGNWRLVRLALPALSEAQLRQTASRLREAGVAQHFLCLPASPELLDQIAANLDLVLAERGDNTRPLDDVARRATHAALDADELPERICEALATWWLQCPEDGLAEKELRLALTVWQPQAVNLRLSMQQ